MVFSLIVEYILDSTLNFRSWKINLLFILDGNEIKYYVNKYVSKPEDVEEKTKHKKNEVKAKRILIYYVKDHLIPHIVQLKNTKAMYDSLELLFKRINSTKEAILEESTPLYDDD